MKTQTNRIKMKQAFSVLVITLASISADAGLLKQHTEAQAKKSQISEEALTVKSDAAINFDEWESDFNKSLKDSGQQTCKGKNCKFKEMQALDPSFEF